MSEQHAQIHELVDAYLDGDLDATAWQTALNEHGEVLQAALTSEQELRHLIAATAHSPVPSALREKLYAIPQAHPSPTPIKKPRLLLLSITSAFSLAACILLAIGAYVLNHPTNPTATATATASAMNTASTDTTSPTNALAKLERPQSDADKGRAAPFAAPRPTLSSSPSKQNPQRKRQGQKKNSPERANSLEPESSLEIEVLSTTDSRAAKPSQQAAEPAIALAAAPSEPPTRNQDSFSDSVRAGAATSTNSDASDRNKDRSKDKSKNDDESKTDTATDSRLSDNDIDAARAEAQVNLAQNKQLRKAVAAKQTQPQRNDATSNQQQISVFLQAQKIAAASSDDETKTADTSAGISAAAVPFDPAAAPALHLKLSATRIDDYYRLEVGMANVELQWLKAAILDLRLEARDARGKILWTSPIKTHSINTQLIQQAQQKQQTQTVELRSDGHAPNTATTLVLTSLQQYSNAIALP